jgi:hypothetical protein
VRWPSFVGQSYVSQSPLAVNEEMMNWYLEKNGSPGATVPYTMLPTPGLRAFATTEDSPGRAAFSENGQGFVVIGGGFYQVFETGVITRRGVVARDAFPAQIASNGDGQIAVTSADHLYVYVIATMVFTEVLTHGATQVASLGGYFVLFDIIGQQIRVSELFNGLVWDPLQASGRSLAPDPWRAMIVNNGYIYLFGEKTSEIWKNIGGSSFPLAPLMSTVLPFGIASTWALTALQQSVAWINSNEAGAGQVMSTAGVNPREIQTHAVARIVGNYTTIADTVAWGYQEESHAFLTFDFPSAQATWTYDNDTGLWHRRGAWDSAHAIYRAARPCAHFHAWGQHFVLDRNSGTVYQQHPSFGLDADDKPIRRLRRPPMLYDDNKRLFLGAIEVIHEPGLALSAGQGSDPQMILRNSANGGKTWGSWRTRSAGKLGEYDTQLIWNRNGSGRKPQIELVVSDPIPWRILDATVEVEREAA